MAQMQTQSVRELEALRKKKLAGQLPTQAGVPDLAFGVRPENLQSAMVPNPPFSFAQAPQANPPRKPYPTVPGRVPLQTPQSTLDDAPTGYMKVPKPDRVQTPQSYFEDGPVTYTGQQPVAQGDKKQALLARQERDRLMRVHNTAYNDPRYQRGASPELAGVRFDLANAKEAAQGLSMEAPDTRVQTPEQVATNRARLNEQAKLHWLEQAKTNPNQDHWADAGAQMVPANLRDQKFSSQQDQIRHQQFLNYVGQSPTVNVQTGDVTTPGGNRFLAEQERVARAKALAGQDIDFAPYSPDEARAGVERQVQRFNEARLKGDSAYEQIQKDMSIDAANRRLPAQIFNQSGRLAIAEGEQQITQAEELTKITPERIESLREIEKLRERGEGTQAKREAGKQISGVNPQTLLDNASPKLAQIRKRFGSLVPGVGQYGFMGDLSMDTQTVRGIRRTTLDPLQDLAEIDAKTAKQVAASLLALMPPPNAEGGYTRGLFGTGPLMRGFVEEMNLLRSGLEALADAQ